MSFFEDGDQYRGEQFEDVDFYDPRDFEPQDDEDFDGDDGFIHEADPVEDRFLDSYMEGMLSGGEC